LFKGRVLASASAPVARAVRSRILGQIGYVRQRDIFMESLTVFETLYFTARLRMPRTVSHEEKLRRVHELIATLGLEACAQTTIGSTMRRGVSGGELKRVNIANELLGLPAILACDEPTSGLDSACALSVMQQLKTHARTHQIALICSIHQPSSQIAKLFDTALLLAPGGRQTYLGAAANIKGYLAQHGYALPEEHTVADYTLDLLASQPDADKLLAIWQERELASHEKGVAPLVVVVTPAARDSETHARGAGFCEQTIVLMQRQIKQARGTLLARNEVLLSVLVGVITGTIWFGAAVPGADGLPPSKRALEGVIFYTLAHLSWWPLYDRVAPRCALLPLVDHAGIDPNQVLTTSRLLPPPPLPLGMPTSSASAARWPCSPKRSARRRTRSKPTFWRRRSPRPSPSSSARPSTL
jgi:ABC-type multidrug transport system ATPase subunit